MVPHILDRIKNQFYKTTNGTGNFNKTTYVIKNHNVVSKY